MSFLPTDTYLGKLELIETYEYYDRPVLFACRNAADTIYLVVLKDEDDETETWLYVAVSTTRFNHVRSGAIELKSAFTDAENGIVFEVTTPVNEKSSKVKIIDVANLKDEDLPFAGEKLSLATPTLKVLEADLTRKAEQAQREFFRIELSFDDRQRTEAPAKILGEILASTQDVINWFGLTLSPLYRDAKRVTNDLASLLELSVLDLGARSFEIEMASSQAEGQLAMFDRDLLGNSIQAFLNLINTESTNENLQGALKNYKTEVANRYLTFLKSVGESRINETQLSWASPLEGRSATAKLTSPKVFATIEILETLSDTTVRDFRIIGLLTGLFITSPRRFQIQDLQNTEYNGNVSKDVTVEDFDFISNATLNQRYRATLREIKTTKVVTGAESINYELFKLETLR